MSQVQLLQRNPIDLGIFYYYANNKYKLAMFTVCQIIVSKLKEERIYLSAKIGRSQHLLYVSAFTLLL